MIITIIGSISKEDKMLEVKEFFESMGNTVNCPCDKGWSDLDLYAKRITWIEKIKEADLIVVIPKGIWFNDVNNANVSCLLDTNGSTPHELSIANYLGKKILYY